MLVMGHHDADGLAALALLARALQFNNRPYRLRIVGRGENPWSSEMATELESVPAGGIIAADLGVRPGAIKAGVRTVLIDHHVPTTASADGVVITGYGLDPVPTSSLIAYWCATELAPSDRWLWIAAVGIIGDMAESAEFPEMEEARRRYGVSLLRDVTALINAPRRSSSADAKPALALLLKAEHPRDVLSGRFPETETLHAAREEVKRELERVKRIAPIIRNGVALLRFSSACQIHPLVAQSWRHRLSNAVVLAANTGYRPGWVHFAARTAQTINLIEFLAQHAPPGADENYGGGHERASGGALRMDDWNTFIGSLGFGPEAQVEV